ncbi:MAG: hypothetical protein O3A00_28570 [Planctomycetota bacterium]|nr:hypothetical protein [Planctomycetota bacterium]
MKVHFSWFSIGILLIAGCGGESGPTLHAVKGTITQGGQPLKGVQVSFIPVVEKEATNLPTSTGTTDDQGAFNTLQGGKGAVAGKHKVVLAVVASTEANDAAYAKTAAGGPPAEPKAPFPDTWKQADTTPKTVEVTSGDNDIKIEL